MVSIIRKRNSNSDSYYLYYDSKGTAQRQYEEYLGKSIPPDVEKRMNDFILRILRGELEPKPDNTESEKVDFGVGN